MGKESNASSKLIRRYTAISGVIDVLKRRELPLLDPQNGDDRNDRYFMQLFKEFCGVKGLYALCAAMCPETYHHWRVFTEPAAGACIVIQRKPLERYLREIETPEVERVRSGEVEYLRLPEVRKLSSADMVRLPFLKRLGFADEDEYRVVLESNEDQQSAIYIDCPIEWIHRIYLNPWLPARLAESVIETLKDLPGCGHLDIRQSRLIDSTTWKKAGDRASGKKVRPGLTVKTRKGRARAGR